MNSFNHLQFRTKIAYLSIFTGTMLGLSSQAQDCNISVEKGHSYMLQSLTYETPIDKDVTKFTKMKPAKQDALANEHNSKVEEGKAKTKYTYDIAYEVKEKQELEGYTYAKLTTTINNVEYTSHMICDNDTLYLMRKEGKQQIENTQGQFTGYGILGTQVLPRTLEVGDTMPVYFDHVYTSKSNVVEVAKVNSVSEGSWKTTITYSMHDVLEVSNTYTMTIHYMAATVTDTREFVVDGKSYTAYVIESESWTKTFQKNEYESLDGEVNDAKMTRKVNKMIDKKQGKVDRATRANELGFIVTPRVEWYVPELGVVNLVVNSFGFVTNETKLISIK